MYPLSLLSRHIQQSVRVQNIVQFPESVTQPTKQPYRFGRYLIFTSSKHVFVEVWVILYYFEI